MECDTETETLEKTLINELKDGKTEVVVDNKNLTMRRKIYNSFKRFINLLSCSSNTVETTYEPTLLEELQKIKEPLSIDEISPVIEEVVSVDEAPPVIEEIPPVIDEIPPVIEEIPPVIEKPILFEDRI